MEKNMFGQAADNVIKGKNMSVKEEQVADLTALFSPEEENGPVIEVRRPFGHTQGRKGQKARRITMAFSDDNHDYILNESRKRGMSATAFVNMVLDLYKESPEGNARVTDPQGLK